MKINIESNPPRDMDKDPFSQRIRIPITGLNIRLNLCMNVEKSNTYPKNWF